jgi:serine/threonine protein kinase
MEIDVSDIALPFGWVLNRRYKIDEIYYWGHTSILYMCQDFETKELVVVKEFCPYFFANRDLDGHTVICKGNRYEKSFEQTYQAFEQECEIVKQLQKLKKKLTDHVLKYLDSFEENNTRYLVTEYIDGNSLDDMVAQEVNFSVRNCMKALIKTVRAIHKMGIYHRDIKPANIIVHADGSLVLVDFGSACYKNKQNNELAFVSRGYSAPELYSNQESYSEADVYSIGALFYFILTGRQPTGADDREKGEELIDVSKLVTIPSHLGRFIMKALNMDRKKRLKSLWIMERLLDD